MAQEYFVSGTGNDNNNGLSETSAFRTLQTAVDRLQPGDTLYVMNGTYTQSDPNKSLVEIVNKNGSEDKWTTIKAYSGHTPKLKVKGSNGIHIAGSSYVKVEGLDLEGSKDEVTLDYARQEQNNFNNPVTNSSGISITPSYDRSGINGYSHHIVISDNKVRNFTAAGIGAEKADYVTIEKNTVSGNSWYSPLGTSGIGIIYSRNTDNNTNDYKFIIRDNVVHDNKNLIAWSEVGKINEGHGIIIDDGLNTQANSTGEPYNGKTLIAGNTVYKNGGYGIQAYSSSNVDIVNNTTYQNSRSPELSGTGEIVALNSKNVRGYNNIMYTTPDRRANVVWESENVIFDRNLAYNYKTGEFRASDDPNAQGLQNILGEDPKFVDPENGNFALQSGSPAIDMGSDTFNGVVKTDQLGNARPQDGDGNGSAITDIGALEFGTKSASSGNATVMGVSKSPSSITEGTEDDTLTGTGSSNQILPKQGNGSISNNRGDDVLTNGYGKDRSLYADKNSGQSDRILLNYGSGDWSANHQNKPFGSDNSFIADTSGKTTLGKDTKLDFTKVPSYFG
ncbi:choice-of-anchor Q domain-containing protein [Fischerella sp. PCC 9605]|uniref:choice-of-anchor Q domain-containing protein n=1 Tax=Fischerella sp. PCC 9605 TaxID=1173024 RepID=UPI0004B9A1C5|nr:right-handed parallel beta-helix repeat-containing protein [Fischerella sp. PCC 9605]